jgi:neutral ceramidase
MKGGRMNPENSDFLIGVGIHDVTGPAADVGMMGYSVPYQKTAGIHMRLRSRAFVISSLDRSKIVAIVSADVGMIFQAVKQGVLRKLEENDITKGIFRDENVLLSANHTHSGPGGYSHYSLYNLSIMCFDEVNYNCIVNGIFQSILKAYGSLQEGHIFINRGELDNAGINRSREAYKLNPPQYNLEFGNDTNKEMTLLKFVTAGGKEIGVLNWFAVHSTSLGNTNRLISGDNKGYASYRFEKMKGADYTAEDMFVAAFAQAESGDVTPNIWGYPNGVDDFEHMKKIGDRQFEKAKALYDEADIKIAGKIDFRHVYVNLSDVQIEPEFEDDESNVHTCKPAIGFSKIAGSTEDGVGVEFIPEGMTFDAVTLPPITLVPELQECQGKKRILIPTGEDPPFHLSQEKMPVQIVTIGQLALLAVPFECTTMAGRYLKKR